MERCVMMPFGSLNCVHRTQKFEWSSSRSLLLNADVMSLPLVFLQQTSQTLFSADHNLTVNCAFG